MEVPQEKKLTVETFDGPVEYEFTNFPSLLDTSPASSPPRHKEKKPKKRKKHKKKRREKKRRSSFSLLWPVLTLGIFSVLAYFIIFPVATPATKRRENLIVTQRGHNTTAVPFDARIMKADRVLPLLLVEHMKQRANLHVLCMHHLRYPAPTYQACAVRSGTPDIFYYMVNPRIIRLDDKEIVVQEDSIASVHTQQKKRRRCILAEWTDHSFNLTGRLCGSPAISLQMAIEEFKNGKTGAQKI